jgi:hypothetical protein
VRPRVGALRYVDVTCPNEASAHGGRDARDEGPRERRVGSELTTDLTE